MTRYQVASTIIQISSVSVSLIVLMCLLFAGRFKTKIDRLYLFIVVFNILSISSDFFASIFEIYDTGVSFYAVRIFNFILYVCNFMMADHFFVYFTEYLSSKTTVTLVPRTIIHIFTVICLGLLIVNTEIPIYYSFEPQYTRGALYWLSQMPGVYSFGVAGVMLIVYRRSLEYYEKIAMWTYIFLPLAAILLQMRYYGIAFMGFANTIGCVVVFVFLQMERDRKLAQQEKEIMVNQINVTLSQIQPHFLNNALNTIQYLCETDPEQASKVVGRLSKYIRMNLDSLSQKNTIPFDQDLEHLENYLAVERVRFPDIEFEYDIKVTDFNVPPLTLQPMVENAIKHGVRQLESGGTIQISTYAERTDNVITIKDNGGGFDPVKKKDDSRSHIGLSNTANRLHLMCGGRLFVNSKKGEGTKITIKIPKEHGENL